MKLPVKERTLSWAVVLALAAVLALLAVLQYRWSGEVSSAESARMQADLQSAMMGFRQDLARELGRICLELQPDSGSASELDGKTLSRRFNHWQKTASHAGLVSEVYLWNSPGSQDSRLLRLSPAEERFEAVAWPANLNKLRDRLQVISSDLRFLAPPPQAANGEHHLYPGRPVITAEFRDRELRGSEPGRRRRIVISAMPWGIDQNLPALVYPVFHSSKQPNAGGIAAWMIIQLNATVLEQHILPELAQHHFGGAGGMVYQVAVLHGATRVYSSDAAFAGEKAAKPDAAINLWGPPVGPPGRRPGFDTFVPFPRPTHSEGPVSPRERNEFFFAGPVRLDAIHYSPDDSDWQVIAKHRKGSVEAAVAGLRRRNLAVSFGILLVLAATMGLVLVTSQRARRLAQLQMNFVAGVSHELRTPLAVISSAADNIAAGVVVNEQQLTRYGSVIRNQARQLTQLIEQVLQYAAARQGRVRYNLQPVRVVDVIEAALESTADVIGTAQVQVERRIDTNLPLVKADFAALSHCLQNLITNAVKYGGENRWIGIDATADPRAQEVRITVEDRGIGIDSADLAHIFDPFYRSPSVSGSPIHGSGLGLTLAKNIATAMCGRITVGSHIGRGTAFTVHLPALIGAVPQETSATDAMPTPGLAHE